MKVMDDMKKILDVFSMLVKSSRGFFFFFFFGLKASIPSHKACLYNSMFHFTKHFNQVKVKFHLDYYKSNR